jgi:DNA-binding NarL/FixJ family response regulator
MANMEALNKLTPRQQEIALLVSEGWEDKLISHRLGVVQETIKTHLMRIYAVFGLRNRTQLAYLVLTDKTPPSLVRNSAKVTHG